MTAVHGWSVSSEAVYMAVGEEVQNLHRKVSQVRDGIRRSTEIFVGEEIGEMRRGLATAAEVSQTTADLSRERSEALARLRGSVEIAVSGSTAVVLVFRLLDYVVLIARAHVEGMSDGQYELGPFTAHVAELVSVGEGVARGIDESTQLLGRCLAQSRAFESQTGLDGTSLIDDFLALAAHLDEQQGASSERREAAHAAFTSIWKAIGGIVAGLQFHDMARQRLEHTIANLGRMADLHSKGLIDAGLPPIAEHSRPAALRRIAALEIAQLDDLRRLYETKMGELDGHLAEIGGQVVQSQDILGQLVHGGGGAMLDTEARHLQAQFKDGEQARLRLGKSLARCAEATQSLIDMTGKLDQLEHDLKIAGLNAAVRAAHVKSEDDTIGYIARVICEQASIARNEANRVREGVDRAAIDTTDLSLRILPGISAAYSLVEERLTSTSAVLGEAQASSSRELGSAISAASSLAADVTAIRKMMTPHIEGCALLHALCAALAAITAELPQTDASDEEMAAIDEILSQDYTMAEEREIFAAVVGRNVPAASSGAAEGPGHGQDEAMDAILF